jgi:hypothetical protein
MMMLAGLLVVLEARVASSAALPGRLLEAQRQRLLMVRYSTALQSREQTSRSASRFRQ